MKHLAAKQILIFLCQAVSERVQILIGRKCLRLRPKPLKAHRADASLYLSGKKKRQVLAKIKRYIGFFIDLIVIISHFKQLWQGPFSGKRFTASKQKRFFHFFCKRKCFCSLRLCAVPFPKLNTGVLARFKALKLFQRNKSFRQTNKGKRCSVHTNAANRRCVIAF